MKKNRFARVSGQMLCGLSLSLVLTVAGQDPFAAGGGDEGGGAAGNAGDDPFAASGDVDPFGDPFRSRIFRKGRAGEVLKGQKDQVAVMIEMIEVDHFIANELMLKFSKNANDAGEMRKTLIDLVKTKEAKLQETLWGRSPLEEVGKIEAVVEKIYATEYEPPELPNLVAAGAVAKKEDDGSVPVVEVTGDLYTGATPTAFDTRNIGTTFEFEVAESADQPGKLGISIFLQVVRYLQEDQFIVEGREDEARGIGNIVMPRFSNVTQEFLATVTPGNHTLLGVFKDGGDKTEEKRVIVLMHADIIAKE